MGEATQPLKPDREAILDLNFVPQWARKDPGENHYGEGRRPDRPGRSLGAPRERRRDDRPRRPGRAREDRSHRPSLAPVRALPIEVSFLPEQRRLASLVRQIHHSRRAYPLVDLANLLVHDPDGYLVKIVADKERDADFSLFQCTLCKGVASSYDVLERHVPERHLQTFYDCEEIEGEPPSGSFSCIVRCRRTGILLGPPNHHSYADRLGELHRTRFPNETLDEVKERLETVHDKELIERWKDESRKKTIYRSKEKPDAEPLDRVRAETALARRLPELIEGDVVRAVMPAKVAQGLEDRDVVHAIRRAWTKESRFPLTMSFAMRAAFRHMHLHVFKAGRINFVTHVKPRPIRPEDAVENIAEVLRFLSEFPGSTRERLLETLHPSVSPGTKEAADALQPLSWLIERGHIIEFFNGTLSVPLRGKRKRRSPERGAEDEAAEIGS